MRRELDDCGLGASRHTHVTKGADAEGSQSSLGSIIVITGSNVSPQSSRLLRGRVVGAKVS